MEPLGQPVPGYSVLLCFNFPTRPLWAEYLLGGVGIAVVLGAVMVMISHGFAIPILIAIAVGIAMTFLATRTRFGRYVFAIGGNPEAAELAGINTKKMTMLIFALMGALTGILQLSRSVSLMSYMLLLRRS